MITTIQYYIVLYSTIQYYIVLYSTIQYYIVGGVLPPGGTRSKLRPKFSQDSPGSLPVDSFPPSNSQLRRPSASNCIISIISSNHKMSYFSTIITKCVFSWVLLFFVLFSYFPFWDPMVSEGSELFRKVREDAGIRLHLVSSKSDHGIPKGKIGK